MTGIPIRMEDLTRDFQAVRALDGLSVDVSSGIIFGFLGESGAGKTPTINLLLEPTAGRAEVLGFDPATEGDEVRTRTGALLEHAGIYDQLSAEDNLAFYGRVWHMPAAERQARIREPAGMWSRRDAAEARPGPGFASSSALGAAG